MNHETLLQINTSSVTVYTGGIVEWLYFTSCPFSLQELPEQWNNVKKQAVLMKQTVAPLQATEVGIIRRKLATFDVSPLEE